MIRDDLTVGCKIGTEKFSVDVKVSLPETVEEMLQCANGSMDVVLARFVRGERIWRQEQSGARDYIRSLTAAERKDVASVQQKVQEIVDTADPTAEHKRTGRPAKPAEVTIGDDARKAMASGNMEALAALLAAQGVKLNIA